MDFTVEQLEETFQVSKPKARAIYKVCSIIEKPNTDYHRAVELLDKLCGTFGLAWYKENSQKFEDLEIDFDYLNIGDTYQRTLIFTTNRNILLTSYGDYIEELEKEYYLENEDNIRPAICNKCGFLRNYIEPNSTDRLESLNNELDCPNCFDGKLHF